MSKSEKPARPGADLPFEKALAELEKLVGQMEEGGLTLEQSLAAHKRGLELAKLCRERLDAAQQQVRVLEGDVLKPMASELQKLGAAGDAGERD